MENTKWLVNAWNVSFADVMQAMADVTPQMEFATLEGAPESTHLWWKQPLSCAPNSPLWVGAPEPTWAAIGQLVLSSAGVEGSPAAEARSTYLEIIGQSMGGLAREISGRLSSEVTCGEGGESQLESSSTRVFEVKAKISDSQHLLFYVLVGEGLAAALSTSVPVASNCEEQSNQPPVINDDLAHVSGSRTFELLLDVELPVSVSFGRTSLRIQEALNLVSGSLIELDRAVLDPVELLVNNCVIARGEVVVIEGNYGIRLTEIVSLKERLRQSRRYVLN